MSEENVNQGVSKLRELGGVKINRNKVAMMNRRHNEPANNTPVVNNNVELTVESVGNNLIAKLVFLSNPENMSSFNENFLNPLIRTLSTNRNLYDKQYDGARREILKQSLIEYSLKYGAGSKEYKLISKISEEFANTPFGIFTDVLRLNASDIFIVGDRISFSNGNNERAEEIVIPTRLLGTYLEMARTFVNTTLYSSKRNLTKFDPANAILDYSTFEIRFNVVHERLNASMHPAPIISMRKQLIRTRGEDSNFDVDKYVNSIGVTKEQLDFINYLSFDGSFCIFGETGSGKTTLLKYMGNYRIADKRNLITIEDTPELFLNTNICYLTNDTFTIHDLFKVSLRENPSHMIVGETRSEEIVDILESALVFRCGTTIHADSLEKAILRIVFMVKANRDNYSSADINSLISSTMDGFIYMKNRKVMGVWKRKDNFKDNLEDAITNYVEV